MIENPTIKVTVKTKSGTRIVSTPAKLRDLVTKTFSNSVHIPADQLQERYFQFLESSNWLRIETDLAESTTVLVPKQSIEFIAIEIQQDK